MTRALEQPAISLPVPRLARWMLGSAFAVGALTALAVWSIKPAAISAAPLALLIVLGATAMGLAALAVARPGSAVTAAFLIIGVSSARMVVMLAAAVGLYLAMEPDKGGFWSVILVCALAVLAAETAVMMPALRRAGGPADTSMEPVAA